RVEAFHQHVQDVARRVPPDPGQLEHRPEGDARPLRHADPAEPPLRARGRLAHQLLEEPASVARALDEGDDGARGQTQEVVEAQLDGTLDAVALDAPAPRARVETRRRGVMADEEGAGRR